MNEVTTEEAVKRLILGAAPERHEDLLSLWSQYSPQIEFIEDKEGFSLEAGAFGLVLFNHKSMAQIWLLGFAAQYAFHAYLPYLKLSQLLNLPITSKDFKGDSETKNIVGEATKLLKKTIELNNASSIEHFIWPQGIPEPYAGKPTDVNGSMVFDLLCIGGAYCFLHEIKHVMFKQSDESIDARDEEMQCDKFAREFLLEKIDTYSESTGYPAELVKAKRAMSIGISFLLLLVLTPNAQWFGTDSHPSIANRISALTEYLQLPEDSYFWEYLSCILILVAENNNISFERQPITSQKEFCEFMLAKINESI